MPDVSEGRKTRRGKDREAKRNGKQAVGVHLSCHGSKKEKRKKGEYSRRSRVKKATNFGAGSKLGLETQQKENYQNRHEIDNAHKREGGAGREGGRGV